MKQTVDTQMMNLAIQQAHVTGKYYGKKFSGTAISSRPNYTNYREMLTIKLDAPIEKPGNYMDGGDIIIWASTMREWNHVIDQVTE